MEFTVTKPTQDPIHKYYQLLIGSPPVFVCEGGDMSGITFTGDNVARFDMFIDSFLSKASSYFSKPLEKTLFLQRVAYHYSTGDYEGSDPAQIQQISWIPVRILFYPARYEIHWRVASVELIPPGTMLQEADVEEISSKEPPRRMMPPESIQRITRQKIRQARIRCAFAKLNLERLIERYYSKYGHFDGLSDADSELSSSEES
jgi:hypothetical protein